jgi:alpha/beta superfamily hydrolase
VHQLVDRVSKQKGVSLDIRLVDGANHFFSAHLDEAMAEVSSYLDAALANQMNEEDQLIG